jgi:hypothetical protein
MSFTKLDYRQYLLSSQVNYTLTNLVEHLESFSHDTINRYLKGQKLPPLAVVGAGPAPTGARSRSLWCAPQGQPQGHLDLHRTRRVKSLR